MTTTNSPNSDASLFFIDIKGKPDTHSFEASDLQQKDILDSPNDGICAWKDSDDDCLNFDLGTTARARKLRVSRRENKISGREYERRLRKRAEDLNPRPKWATLIDITDDDENVKNLTLDPFSILDKSNSSLVPDNISLRRLRNTNSLKYAAQKSGGGKPKAIVSIDEHPNQLNWILVASADRTVTVYEQSPDGLESKVLHTIKVSSWNIQSARFSRDGKKVLIVGDSSSLFLWDICTGSVLTIPRISGRHEDRWTDIVRGSRYMAIFSRPIQNQRHENTFKNTSDIFGQPKSKRLAHKSPKSDGSAAIVLLYADTFQVAGVVRTSASTMGISFCPVDPELMYAIDSTARLYVFSLKAYPLQFKCQRVIPDYGGPSASAIAISPDGALLAVGSNLGVLNIYQTSAINSSRDIVEPIRSLMNLTTRVGFVEFHPAGELLLYGSPSKDGAVRLVHLGTMRVYSNWPKETSPVGKAVCATCSPNGKAFTIGNGKGAILRYEILQYCGR